MAGETPPYNKLHESRVPEGHWYYPSYRDHKTFSLSQSFLISIKGKEAFQAEMLGCSKVEDIHGPVASLHGVGGGKCFGNAVDIRPLHRCQCQTA